ncbi:putative ribonuclease H-like domain-containing protein, partial [Tanacetum coccineum]
EIVYSNDDEEVGAEADMNNLAIIVPVGPIPTTRVHKDQPLEQIIRDIHSAPQTRRMIKNVAEHVEPKKMDVKSAFLYGKIEEEVYVCQPPGFEDPEFPNKVYKVEKRGQIDKTLFIKRVKCDILLVQVYVDDIIFGSTKKGLCTEFEKLIQKKFQMSYMGELTFFLGLTPMETSKPLLKDAKAEDVDVHLYR